MTQQPQPTPSITPAPSSYTTTRDTSWDTTGLTRLAEQGNPANLALLDLCASESATPVTVAAIAQEAAITVESVRGQLAGLTMRLKNPKYGFDQNTWPVEIAFTAGASPATP
jgi:hypothetical protein